MLRRWPGAAEFLQILRADRNKHRWATMRRTLAQTVGNVAPELLGSPRPAPRQSRHYGESSLRATILFPMELHAPPATHTRNTSKAKVCIQHASYCTKLDQTPTRHATRVRRTSLHPTHQTPSTVAAQRGHRTNAIDGTNGCGATIPGRRSHAGAQMCRDYAADGATITPVAPSIGPFARACRAGSAEGRGMAPPPEVSIIPVAHAHARNVRG